MIKDHLTSLTGYTQEPSPGCFIPIHMASQGYWQLQDELQP